jgi:GNAT superfamily N-acetyltransferase
MVEIGSARRDDVAAIVRLLADDVLGQSRELVGDPPADDYLSAFEAIDADPNQLLAVMTEAHEVIGTLQLTFIPGLSRRGALRGQIEAVRIAQSCRGRRLGEQLLQWAIDRCRERGCMFVQLTTDRSRTDAHRFYDRLGFEPSHLGYKLKLGE